MVVSRQVTRNNVIKNSQRYIKNDVEERVAKILSLSFLFVYFVLPQYFGIDLILFDMSAQRLFVVIFLIYLLENAGRMKRFANIITFSPGRVWLILYLFVLLYTAVYARHLGTILYSVFEFVAMFIVVYITKYILGIKETINYIRKLCFLLCILGLVEFVMRKSPFSYLETLSGMYTGAYIRAGNYRIMGPANHSLGYGLMLVVMAPFSCIDVEKDEVNFLRYPVCFCLIVINVFLTSSRSTLAVFALEIVLLFIISDRQSKKRCTLVFLIILIILGGSIVVFYGSSYSNYILLQFSYVVDEILGTSYAAKFGADLTQLYNSRTYREQLPYIFTIGLNPIVGRGSQAPFYWRINGWSIHSIDNFYIAQFVRYAYPGLVTYVFYILSFVIKLLGLAKEKTVFFKTLFIGITMYFLNLYWVDALMTYKYVYILLALFIASYSKEKKRFVAYGE